MVFYFPIYTLLALFCNIIYQIFKDERCSFDIQMWNLHMKGLQHDLWSNCPPMAAQNIYSRTLQDSLYLFEQRYSAVKPSYRRTKQVK